MITNKRKPSLLLAAKQEDKDIYIFRNQNETVLHVALDPLLCDLNIRYVVTERRKVEGYYGRIYDVYLINNEGNTIKSFGWGYGGCTIIGSKLEKIKTFIQEFWKGVEENEKSSN